MTHYPGDEPAERVCQVTGREQSVVAARRFAEQVLAAVDARAREAAVMAIQEFAENLAKYGTSEGIPGTIAVTSSGGRVRIRVNSVACSREDGERVEKMIHEINASENVGELYRRRQRELFEDPSLPRVRLGLLRVAFEGRFRLACFYEHPLLEIVAERS